jgi:hypothetical protein
MDEEGKTTEEFNLVAKDFEELKKKFQDPVFIGTLLHTLAEERTSANMVLKEINAKLEKLAEIELRLANIAGKIEGKQEDRNFVSEVDGEILKFVKQKGFCTAEEVQRKFKYKGANGASARLNNLFKTNFLDKKQAGKKMVFFPK